HKCADGSTSVLATKQSPGKGWSPRRTPAPPPAGGAPPSPPPPFYPPTRDEAGAEPGGEPAASRQRWRVIMFWIIGIALVLLLIVLHLTGAFAPGAHG